MSSGLKPCFANHAATLRTTENWAERYVWPFWWGSVRASSAASTWSDRPAGAPSRLHHEM